MSEEKKEGGVSRRSLLKGVGIGVAGVAVGVAATKGADYVADQDDKPGSARYTRIELNETVNFYDQDHPAGVHDLCQRYGIFAMFDMAAGTSSKDLQLVLAKWSAAAALMMQGKPLGDIRPTFSESSVPKDGGEAADLDPCSLSITFGFGTTLFDDRFGISKFKPAKLHEYGRITGDRMTASEQGSDFGILICGNDRQVIFHALHMITRLGRPKTTIKHVIEGFMPVRQSENQPTPRDLFGFMDGTTNPTEDKEYDKYVYISGGDQEFCEGGSYLIYRRTITDLDTWDNKRISDQERLIGRRKDTGAPLSQPDGDEATVPDLEAKDSEGNYLIDPNSHVAITSDIRLGFKVLRHGFNYWAGLNEQGKQLCGFLNTVYVNDPENFFKLRDDMGRYDQLNEYYYDDRSGVYIVPQSPKTGHYIGQEFFE